jgi:hypothetical protein
MFASVGLTRKSQSTNLLGDTLGDWAEYVDFIGDKLPSLRFADSAIIDIVN